MYPIYIKLKNIQEIVLYTPMGYYKNMERDTKPKVMRRLKLIEGQLQGLRRMVEEDAYCIDVIIQTSAVKAAISGIEDLLLENHLSTHVIEQIKDSKEDKAIEEILKVYKLKRNK